MIHGYEVVIGFETHTQLATRSKIFSRAPTAFGAEPNTQACAVDLALPGTLPVMNREAVHCAIKLGLALGSHIALESIFARKNYFYPDLPKGYQISQFEIPVVSGGGLQVLWHEGDARPGAAGVEERERYVRLVRAHLEEDAGKSLHEDFHGMTGIDLNRAGTALLEIVTEPDMRSAREAAAYARTLHALVVWLGICDGNLQEGSFRCDANVSVRPMGQAELGTRCEIKNLNSFRFLERAIEHEAARQIELIADGGRVVQETRLYDPDRDETRSMRGKEDAHDYRYFPDPDLPPLVIDAAWVERVRAALPELPAAMRERFGSAFGLSAYDAAMLTASRGVADFYEATLRALPSSPADAAPPLAKTAANWVMGELAAALNRDERPIEDSRVAPAQLARLVARIDDGTISGKSARDLFAELWSGGSRDADAVDRLIDAKGLRQMSDTGELERVVDEVVANNAKSVAEFRAGRDKAFNALVGQVMKATRGKANPQQVNELLRRRLG
ncbi:MAG: Asp-tRNA(Asn)/Glu-tRNA(Gln) amidotransferase subunit GatB [Burkholderiaceae bacterium]|nr:Asp-tRNA(Asn)/Glu-tRNA(Gln) amidotransferase subunit GatB [Burkholderiaceae bacterium]